MLFPQIRQKGSNITPERLRFDFNFPRKLTPEEIKAVLADNGPGIADIELAMQEGYSTASDDIREMGFGAGMGLPNIKKNSDYFHIESESEKGTTVTIKVTI